MTCYDTEYYTTGERNIDPHSKVGRLSSIISSGLGMLGERMMEWLPLNISKSNSNGSSGSQKKHLVAPKSGFGSNLTKENMDMIAFGYKLHSISLQSEDDKAKIISHLSMFQSSTKSNNPYGDIG